MRIGPTVICGKRLVEWTNLDPLEGDFMEISRRAAGAVLLVMGMACTVVYFVLLGTSVGTISELAGVGFLFLFIGGLVLLGEVLGVAPEPEE